MKKLIASVLALSMAAVLSPGAFAEEITQDSEEKTAESAITTTIAPTYTITIPEDVAVEFDDTSTPFGTIELTAVQIEPGYAVQVDLEASGSLKNQADNTKTIAYTVSDGSRVFERAQYQAVGDSTALTIDIDQAAWDMAFAGSYADTVTFTVSYVDMAARS